MHFPPLLLALPALGFSYGVQQDRLLADSDLQPLAKDLGDYADARRVGAGLEEARTGIVNSLSGLSSLLEGVQPLEPARDLGRAVWLSREYGEQKLKQGKVTEDVLEVGSFAASGLPYAYRVPKDYAPDERAYPLILTIPDAGEEPAAHLREHWTLGEILDGAVLLCPAMPSDEAEWDRVAVDGRPGGLSHALTALRIATERFAIAPDRVFVAGRGKGVPAAVAAGNTDPQRFAGVIGRAGDIAEITPDNFTNLPTYFAGAGAAARAFQEAGQAAGVDNCTLDSAGQQADLWAWVLAHPRTAHPTKVRLTVGQPFPTRAYWLRVAPMAPDAGAIAEIDREANTVRIESTGVSFVTLYLNDVLVDLDRPVTVTCNGAETESIVPRRLVTMLELLSDGTSDAGSVYVAEAIFDARGAAVVAATEALAADPDFDEHLARATGLTGKERITELWELALWCESTERWRERERVLRMLVRLAPDHAEGRAALGHHGADGVWFSSAARLARFQESQSEAGALERGAVQHKAGWIHPDERGLANKGWVKDWPTGQWLSGAEQKRLDEGWVRQDLDWVEPTELRHVDAGRWKVDGDWVPLDVANRRHAKIENPWVVPSREVVVYSTADRPVALLAQEHMGRALPDLRRVFGLEPVLPLRAAVLRDEEQYDRLAFGDPDGRRRAADTSRLYVIHSAFFAEGWYQQRERKRTFLGMGVCYWDPLVPYGDLYGVHSARLAFGLSYVDAIDPSPKTVKKASSKGPDGIGEDYHGAYQAEKKLPAWFRYGGAVYAERFFRDELAEGDADPWWARTWSLDNLRGRGGLRPLAEVFALELDPANRDDGQKLLLEAGLLVSFAVDGDCAPVQAAHAELKRALVSGSSLKKPIAALEEALLANESALRTFAGL